MGQMGHTDPTVTLGLYAKTMAVSEKDRARLRTLVEGVQLSRTPQNRETTTPLMGAASMADS
jgi:hypothetical protein